MMLSFHYLVQREVNEAVQWYQERSDGLGDDFFVKFTTTLNTIVANPKGHGFWLGSKTVRHDKRRPSYGMSR